MADLVYQKIITSLKKSIDDGEYSDMRLPDERSLAESYSVSRSSIKRALGLMADQGIIFKKRGSGTFVNPLYLKQGSSFSYSGKNLGITDSFNANGQKPGVKVLKFDVVHPDKDLQDNLFLKPSEFVYSFERLRFLDDVPFMIETGYIPIKLAPELSEQIASESIFNYVESELGKEVNKTYLTISAQPSDEEGKKLLNLSANEPVGLMEGIFFLDDGTPFEFSTMKLHYKYFKYDSFVDLGNK
ncbi:GntR family transcriptional regulator [Companilactobacillus paralimentarius DSM 13238 = JCM 10415]|jgi:Transcriptional regulators|uniref:GntR family transcriptional regulator n=1 Tax=Companilactobacillus paralimentarius DSM 13238 = JCM 10415 TaxID=1122151 RepID=A0A0R1PIX2_9LACO|nr:GntR family transcriptional regulator [Companilactobacillus paralimentarius]KAE9563493.1 GntR family transcriptional regulator [Companilactobacillus paralimentarius]KRL29973.1 GntR family transcriptional regulator [Companilactobacillus paralimentarius DSM 13238 = JCM 10415]MDR4932458.1 GntR family transcriptional regulator [Companilactobacillus paralimentarius]QFR69075.1 UTRA domain-containing protein [Companilactobacillus paralimentarius]